MSEADGAPANITQMLREWGDGRREALDELLPHVYAELRRQAARCLRRESPNHSLQTTALVHEAYFARLYVRLGEREQRLCGWKKAAEERNALAFEIKLNPIFDSLRDDPRFQVLLRRVGLPQ